MSGISWFQHSFTFPQTVEPEWSGKVERWYQLDAAAFAVSETFWRHRKALTARPEWILLASPQASNLTDAQFAATLAPSPAKFVHTLPNIRGAALLQVMDWSGQVLCLQKDPSSVLTAISEGMQLVASGENSVWIVTVTGEEKSFTGHIFTLSPASPGCTMKITKNAARAMANTPAHDKDLFLWLNDSVPGNREWNALGYDFVKERA